MPAASSPSVFSSAHGDLAIVDALCRSLAQDPQLLSPMRFHNSVHNATSGYWAIGCRSREASTAVAAIHEPITWTVTVRNNGPGVSLAANLTDTLPVGAEVTGPVTWSRVAPAGGGGAGTGGVARDDHLLLVGHGPHLLQFHADATFASHPLLNLLPENPPRGAGIQIYLFDTDPDVAATRAPALGGTVHEPPRDKPHGLREATILAPEGQSFTAAKAIP
jgi:uncharacterized repeat protein (TIGR01451 family)